MSAAPCASPSRRTGTRWPDRRRHGGSSAGPNRAYAVDDETAFKVTDGNVEVLSEGQWKLLNP